MSNPHIEEAYRLLAGRAYVLQPDGAIEPIKHFCTIAADLRRIDQAIGPSGATPFAHMAATIQAVFVELTAALEGGHE